MNKGSDVTFEWALLCNSFLFIYKVNLNLVPESLKILFFVKSAHLCLFSNIYNISVSQLQKKPNCMSEWFKNHNFYVYGSL